LSACHHEKAYFRFYIINPATLFILPETSARRRRKLSTKKGFSFVVCDVGRLQQSLVTSSAASAAAAVVVVVTQTFIELPQKLLSCLWIMRCKCAPCELPLNIEINLNYFLLPETANGKVFSAHTFASIEGLLGRGPQGEGWVDICWLVMKINIHSNLGGKIETYYHSADTAKAPNSTFGVPKTITTDRGPSPGRVANEWSRMAAVINWVGEQGEGQPENPFFQLDWLLAKHW